MGLAEKGFSRKANENIFEFIKSSMQSVAKGLVVLMKDNNN